jgi:hypothetical protein
MRRCAAEVLALGLCALSGAAACGSDSRNPGSHVIGTAGQGGSGSGVPNPSSPVVGGGGAGPGTSPPHPGAAGSNGVRAARVQFVLQEVH